MVSKVDIGNRALANLGQPPVMALEGPSVASRALKMRFDEARLEALSAAPWNFASRWIAGIQLSIDPKPHWQYVFGYPQEALRIFQIIKTPGERDIPFEVTDRVDGLPGKLVHANVPAPVFEFTVDKADPSMFSADFINAFAWLLAHKVAEPVTKSAKKADEAFRKYLYFVSQASAKTQNEGKPDNDITPTYQAVR